MIVHIGAAKLLGGLALAASIAASVGHARVDLGPSGRGHDARASFFGLPGTLDAAKPPPDDEDELFPAAAAERTRLIGSRAAALERAAKGMNGSLDDALERAAQMSDRLAPLPGGSDVTLVPEAVRAIADQLRARADSIAALSDDATAAQGEASLARASADLARDSEALLERSLDGGAPR